MFDFKSSIYNNAASPIFLSLTSPINCKYFPGKKKIILIKNKSI